MKIICERCRADYDIEDAKIPASGFKMTCPACSNVITAKKPPAAEAASGPKEIALSSFDEPSEEPKPEETIASPSPSLSLALADEVDFSQGAPAAAPGATPAPPALDALELADEPELPAPVRAAAPTKLAPAKPATAASAGAPQPPQEEIDLPAPRAQAAADRPKPSDGGVDLPAPKAAARPPMPVAAPRKPEPPPQAGSEAASELPDLPAPRGALDLPAPKGAAKPPAPKGAVDLPAPKSALDLPAPKSTTVPPLPKAAGAPPLPKAAAAPPPPKAASAPPVTDEPDFGVPLDLDAPDVDDVSPGSEAVELQPIDDSIGLPAPRPDGIVDLPAPRPDGSVDLPAPRPDGSVDLPTPRPAGSGAHPTARAAAADAARPDLGAAEEPADFSRSEPSPRAQSGAPAGEAAGGGRKKIILVASGLGLLAAIGGGVFALGLVGGGGGAKRVELDTKLGNARRALADDTLASFKRAASELKPLSSGEKPSEEAALLEAQAHLLQAQLGVPGELAAGKALLERPPAEPTPSPERPRAEGLRFLAAGDLAGARKALKEVVSRTPLDAAALSYLGWVELDGRDLAASENAFGRAASAEGKRAQALYGLGLAKERAGDGKGAASAYDRALAASPEHFRARLGKLRIVARGGDAAAVAQIEALVSSKAAQLAPREQAEAQATLGLLALDSGRRDDADERFRKAVSLDGDAAISHVAWDARLGLSRTRVLDGRGVEALDDLRKLVALDLRGVDARLLLAEVLIDKQEAKEAEALLTAAQALRAKEARIPLLRARLLLSRATAGKDEREQAVTLLREATTAEPRLLVAWAAQAKVLNDLGRTNEALEALGKSAEALAEDPRGAAVIGAAYLSIGKPVDAEARFRTVLAAFEGKAGPEQVPVWIGLGEALEAQNKLAEAQSTYSEAQKLSPKMALLVERQGRIAARLGKDEDARKLFDAAMELGSPSISLRIASAELALKTGRLPDARKLIESVIKDDDRSALGALLLSRIELETGHPDEAIGYARRAAILQDLPEAHLHLAQLLERSGKFDAALTEYMLARRPPTTERASLGRARVLVRQGTTRDALAELGPLTKVEGLRGEAFVLQGDSYSDLLQPDKARRAYEDAVKADPQLADAAFKLGRAQLDAGKRQPGVDMLERAVKLATPKTAWLADAHLLLGDAHRAAKHNELAVKAYQKYLELAPPTAPMRAEAQRQVSMLGGR